MTVSPRPELVTANKRQAVTIGADILGMTRATIARHLDREDFPRALALLRTGPVWDAADVEGYFERIAFDRKNASQDRAHRKQLAEERRRRRAALPPQLTPYERLMALAATFPAPQLLDVNATVPGQWSPPHQSPSVVDSYVIDQAVPA